MQRYDLKAAIDTVSKLGLASCARTAASMPKSMLGRAYSAWAERCREVEQETRAKLEAAGVEITDTGDAVRVRFAGVSATSTLGLCQALRNWKSRAFKRLAKEKGQ